MSSLTSSVPTPCPCGLTREELVAVPSLVGTGGLCTAEWMDGSKNICGRPLGAHPRTTTALPANRHSPPVRPFVVILGLFTQQLQSCGLPSAVELVGTAFAVTRRHVLTANHNLCEIDGITPRTDIATIYIGSQAEKRGDKRVFSSPIQVTVRYADPTDDYVILEICDPAHYFTGYIPICPFDMLPSLSFQSAKVKAIIAPIGQFETQPYSTMQVWHDDYQIIRQFDGPKKIIVKGGLYSGSCGAPYLDESGRAVALHLVSCGEGRNFSESWETMKARKRARKMSDILDEVSTQMAEVYAADKEGLVLCACADLMNFVTQELATFP